MKGQENSTTGYWARNVAIAVLIGATGREVEVEKNI
jgi:hypothetical protein